MPLKAGVVQFSPLYGRVRDNLDRLEALVKSAADQGAQLIVLPEMAWTGYLWADPASIRPYSEEAGGGPGQEQMTLWARRWKLSMAFGFPERAADGLYNSQGFVDAEGNPGPVYRKTHLFEADEWWARPGNSGYRQWATPWGEVGSGICMDLNYPDLPDFHASAGTEILAFSTNWLDQDFDVIPYWLKQLKGTNGVGFQGTVLFANRGGAEFGVAFRGQSSVVTGGRLVATLKGTDDGVLVVGSYQQRPKYTTPGSRRMTWNPCLA